MAISNLETGNFVNAAQNYFSAPQQLNAEGFIRGHSHVVIEALTSLDQTSPTDPTKFSFFKGLNGAAQGGILTADVAEPGLPAGVYKLSSINTAANHQPVLVPIAQHGSLDDAVYVSVLIVLGECAVSNLMCISPSSLWHKSGIPFHALTLFCTLYITHSKTVVLRNNIKLNSLLTVQSFSSQAFNLFCEKRRA